MLDNHNDYLFKIYKNWLFSRSPKFGGLITYNFLYINISSFTN